MLQIEATVQTGVTPSVLPQVIAQSALLELNALELEDRVREELEENPALELADEILQPVDYFAGTDYSSSSGSYSDSYNLWANLADTWDLRDDLHREFEAVAHDEINTVGNYLIETMNDEGYVTSSVEEAAGELGVDRDTATRALEAIQNISADGLGARDLAECLRLQLQQFETEEIPEGTQTFLDNLAFFSGDETPKEMAQLTTLSESQVKRILEFIRAELKPYPGQGFQPAWHDPTEQTQYVYPDVVLSVCEDGEEVRVQIPQSTRLAMRINAAYRVLDRKLKSQKKRAQDEDLKQARRMVREARQFIDSITRRHQTMSQVMAAIVNHQKEFILKGPRHLKPLNKKEIADRIDVHEATVCRATKDKYMLMPDGSLKPIDIFFDDALPAKHLMNRLISSEDKANPLSDNELRSELEKEGFELARRTVTKYRLQMNIPSANERRREDRQAA